MCDALQAAHDAGIIHRDLKPENILLITKEGQPDFVKVLDFGIAKSADVEETTAKTNRKLTRPGVAMGTPEYMAPEQAAGKPADPRSDIYAVGSIIYEMLTGTAPYDGDNVMEVLHKKANQAPAPLRSLRPDLSPLSRGPGRTGPWPARPPSARRAWASWPPSCAHWARAGQRSDAAALDADPARGPARQPAADRHGVRRWSGLRDVGPVAADAGRRRRGAGAAGRSGGHPGDDAPGGPGAQEQRRPVRPRRAVTAPGRVRAPAGARR